MDKQRKKRTFLNCKQIDTILTNCQEYTIPELSEKMNIPYSTIRNYLARNNLKYKKCNIKGGNKDLTPAEEKVIKLLSMGVSNKEISEKLCVSITTVKTHLNSIYQKYHLYNHTSEYSTLRLLAAFKYLGIKTQFDLESEV